MYRSYEDPYKVDQLLSDIREELEKVRAGIITAETDEVINKLLERMSDLQEEAECLEDRSRFAWDDDEYDELNASDSWDNFISCFD